MSDATLFALVGPPSVTYKYLPVESVMVWVGPPVCEGAFWLPAPLRSVYGELITAVGAPLAGIENA